MEKRRILVVDDEWNMRNLISIHLSKDFTVLEAACGQDALVKLKIEVIDIVILDIMMTDMSGWEVCKKIRETSNIPILMLTALGDVDDKVQGFEIGADDYLVKPFQPEELVIRVKALLRRSNLSNNSEPLNNEDEIEIDDLKIEQLGRRVFAKDRLMDLTPKEYDLLLLFVLNSKTVYTREMLLDCIWGFYDVLDIRTVDTHVKNLREKFRNHNLSFNPIKTVWGIGYKFQGPDGEK